MNYSGYALDDAGYHDSGREDLDGDDNDLVYIQAGLLTTGDLTLM